jgi:hypothetical protein
MTPLQRLCRATIFRSRLIRHLYIRCTEPKQEA